MLENTELNQKKYRHEYKYICSDEQLTLIESRINNLLKIDKHVIEDKKYTIRSLYFDNYNDRCFYENEDGIDPREKFRIRIYNNDDSRISLELKQKYREKTHKEAELISRDIVENFIENKIKYNSDFSKLLNKLYILNKKELMKPVIIVEYERVPYVYKEGNVRITLDKNISSSKDIKNFFNKKISKRPVMSKGYHILEVKFDEFLPDYIYRNLQLENLQQIAFSKYYLCRKFSL